MATPSQPPKIGPELMDFLVELGANNNREWFQANKERYIYHVKKPTEALIAHLATRLSEPFADFLESDDVIHGSMFRIYRDIRFSKDKRPYKEHVAMHFKFSENRNVHVPGLYLHVSTEELLMGAGIWRPESGVLLKIRTRIEEHPDEWQEVRDNTEMAKYFALSGESLKRPPRGFPAEHPFVDDLKRKDFIVAAQLKPQRFLDADLADFVVDAYRSTQPFLGFICDALDDLP